MNRQNFSLALFNNPIRCLNKLVICYFKRILKKNVMFNSITTHYNNNNDKTHDIIRNMKRIQRLTINKHEHQ